MSCELSKREVSYICTCSMHVSVGGGGRNKTNEGAV